ncbi:hypothetical protein HY857_02240 [Candidatus Saccharibacteria bacterium]|nr:hypothetical protein [Candidatus Saccharibacteria bacterium]
MTKKARKLSSKFIVESYELKTVEVDGKTTGQIKIIGKKTGPPSKRLVFHQKGLKVTAAKILYKNKKGQIEYEPARINHHRGFEEVRIHTASPMYGGEYELVIDFTHLARPPKKSKDIPLRQLFPSIDEPDVLTDFDVI